MAWREGPNHTRRGKIRYTFLYVCVEARLQGNLVMNGGCCLDNDDLSRDEQTRSYRRILGGRGVKGAKSR